MESIVTSAQQGLMALRSASTSLARTQGQRALTPQAVNVGSGERLLSTLLGGVLLLRAARRPSVGSVALALSGGALLHRGVTGHCYVYDAVGRKALPGAEHTARPERSITIERPAEELYRMWHDPRHVSALMSGFAEVEGMPDGRWRWQVQLPLGKSVEWTTTTTEDRPNELIAWRTEPDAPFVHEGSVRFRRAPRDWGTEVTLSMSFGSPGGVLSELTSGLFSMIPKALEEEILRKCKSMIVAGELPTLERNPSARKRTRSSTSGAAARR